MKEAVQLGDRVRYMGIKGHAVAISGTTREVIVRYDVQPYRFAPWVSWDRVEVLPRPKEPADEGDAA